MAYMVMGLDMGGKVLQALEPWDWVFADMK
jgi:hypothetical protein